MSKTSINLTNRLTFQKLKERDGCILLIQPNLCNNFSNYEIIDLIDLDSFDKYTGPLINIYKLKCKENINILTINNELSNYNKNIKQKIYNYLINYNKMLQEKNQDFIKIKEIVLYFMLNDNCNYCNKIFIKIYTINIKENKYKGIYCNSISNIELPDIFIDEIPINYNINYDKSFYCKIDIYDEEEEEDDYYSEIIVKIMN